MESKLLKYFWFLFWSVLVIGVLFWLTPYFKGLTEINPVLWDLGWITIYWYGIFLFIGTILGAWWLIKQTKNTALEIHILNLIPLVVLSGIVGARLVFVILKWSDFSSNLVSIFNLQNGGMSIHGALIFGAGAILIYAKLQKLAVLRIFDIFVPAVLIGQIIGRFGNFFNQEAFGPPTDLPWKMFVKESLRPMEFGNADFFHPTFIYSVIGLSIILMIIIFLKRYQLKPGVILWTYIVTYSLLRIFTEFFRIDSDYWGSLTIAQWASLLIVSISLVTGLILKYKMRYKL